MSTPAFKYVVDVIVKTKVATPVLSHIDILDAVRCTLNDLCPPFPGQLVAFVRREPSGFLVSLKSRRAWSRGRLAQSVQLRDRVKRSSRKLNEWKDEYHCLSTEYDALGETLSKNIKRVVGPTRSWPK